MTGKVYYVKQGCVSDVLKKGMKAIISDITCFNNNLSVHFTDFWGGECVCL